MQGVRGICKECGEEFFVDSENCGTDESICERCFNILQGEFDDTKSNKRVNLTP